jgi:hypothetical protein
VHALLVQRALPVSTAQAPLAAAQAVGALRVVPGEVYPDPVRVVCVGGPGAGGALDGLAVPMSALDAAAAGGWAAAAEGWAVADVLAAPEDGRWGGAQAGGSHGSADVSFEFCGGTHLFNTADCQAFCLVEEGSVAKGVRRVVAVTRAKAAEARAAGEAAARTADGARRLVEQAVAEADHRVLLLHSQVELAAANGEGGGGGGGGGGADEWAALSAAAEGALESLGLALNQGTMGAAAKMRLRERGAALKQQLAGARKGVGAAHAARAKEMLLLAAGEAVAGGLPFVAVAVGAQAVAADKKAAQKLLKAAAKAHPGLAVVLVYALNGSLHAVAAVPKGTGKGKGKGQGKGEAGAGGAGGAELPTLALAADEWVRAALAAAAGGGEARVGGKAAMAQGQAGLAGPGGEAEAAAGVRAALHAATAAAAATGAEI